MCFSLLWFFLVNFFYFSCVLWILLLLFLFFVVVFVITAISFCLYNIFIYNLLLWFLVLDVPCSTVWKRKKWKPSQHKYKKCKMQLFCRSDLKASASTSHLDWWWVNYCLVDFTSAPNLCRHIWVNSSPFNLYIYETSTEEIVIVIKFSAKHTFSISKIKMTISRNVNVWLYGIPNTHTHWIK